MADLKFHKEEQNTRNENEVVTSFGSALYLVGMSPPI